MQKIKTKDRVVVIAGSSKGHVGEVLSVKSNRVVVSGANLVKKAMKPNPQLNQEGGIITREAPMDVSNVAILNEVTNKADRVGFKYINSKKVRYYKSNGELIDAV